MSNPGFTERHIDLQFQMGQGQFGADGSDIFEATGLRISANIYKTGGWSMSELNLRVWGLPLDVMNKLTILGQPIANPRRNSIVVSAGDVDSGVAAVFTGNIVEAWVETKEAPNVAFVVTAQSGLIDAFRPVPATSYKGSVDAALVASGIAGQMQPARTLVNNGVSVQLADPYLPGTALDQLRELARAANFDMALEADTLSIWPVGGSTEEQAQEINVDTGMVGYPAHTESGVAIQTVFNPSLVYGSLVNVKSILTPASGLWRAYAVRHELESELPGGKWFTTIEAAIADHWVPVAG